MDKGIPEGITEKDYFDFRSALLKNINTDELLDTLFNSIRVVSPNETFSTIVDKAANKIIKEYGNNVSGLDLKNGTVYPNYNLRRLQGDDYSLFRNSGRAKWLRDKTISQFVQLPNLSVYSLNDASDENFELAKKAASYLINDLIERYLRHRIKAGCWPIQCKDADEFIFNRNVGKLINEKGTKENFELAYYQAIRVIAKLLETRQRSNESVELSNNDANCLAYSNYLKILIPETLSFLLPYRYNEYELRSANITVSILYDEAKFNNSECVYSDPYGDWNDDYKKTEGTINDIPVRVMEKRIGKITKL
ncbi:MAG: hypothetical protein WC267_02080 [Bacilli bacterium]